MPRLPRPPEPANLLYENIIGRRSRIETLDIISRGLTAILQNAEQLLDDARLLIGSGRYSRARFLIATADEEMAKIYILLDVCRLNFESHEGPIRRLCKAFYKHVEKSAYNKIFREEIRDMVHAKETFQIELQRFWPSSGYGSGEPDMPHETYFTRDSNLYVDFIDYDQNWWIPSNTHSGLLFEAFVDGSIAPTSPLSDAEGALIRIKTTYENGLFRSESLDIFNAVLQGIYVNENIESNQLEQLYNRIAERIENELSISQQQFELSILKGWPLYHFLTISP